MPKLRYQTANTSDRQTSGWPLLPRRRRVSLLSLGKDARTSRELTFASNSPFNGALRVRHCASLRGAPRVTVPEGGKGLGGGYRGDSPHRAAPWNSQTPEVITGMWVALTKGPVESREKSHNANGNVEVHTSDQWLQQES